MSTNPERGEANSPIQDLFCFLLPLHLLYFLSLVLNLLLLLLYLALRLLVLGLTILQ